MEHPEEAAAEAEPEAVRHFRREGEAAVVELELAERLAEVLELVVVDRVQARSRPSASAPCSPASGSAVGLAASVTVSPMLTSSMFLMFAVK